jgi:hypothetical protein
LLKFALLEGNVATYHVVLVHVVPQHLVDSHLEDAFEVRIDRLVQNSTHAELVYVKTGCVPIVEDLRVPETVDGGPVESFLALETGKQRFV